MGGTSSGSITSRSVSSAQILTNAVSGPHECTWLASPASLHHRVTSRTIGSDTSRKISTVWNTSVPDAPVQT